MPTPTQLNFFDLVTRYDDLSHNGDTLESLASQVLLAEFALASKQSFIAPSGSKAIGLLLIPYSMFKILALQARYNLSDDQPEYGSVE